MVRSRSRFKKERNTAFKNLQCTKRSKENLKTVILSSLMRERYRTVTDVKALLRSGPFSVPDRPSFLLFTFSDGSPSLTVPDRV